MAEPIRTSPDAKRLRLARLAECKRDIALSLLEPITSLEKYSSSLEPMGVEGLMVWEIYPITDYLIRYLQTGDTTWRDLYVGKRLEQLHSPSDDHDALVSRSLSAIRGDRERVLETLARRLDAASMKAVEDRMRALLDLTAAGLTSGKEVSLLLVGDCFFPDIVKFLTSALLERGILLRPEYTGGGKDPIDLRNTIRGLRGRKFDLICYSPYTYEFNLSLMDTHYKPSILLSGRKIEAMAKEAHDQTGYTLRLLTELFECSIYVHNTCNIRRHNSTPGSYVKNLVTRSGRRAAGRAVSELLERTMAEMNQTLPRPLLKIDEAALDAQFGEGKLSRKYYDSEPEHPTVLAQKLSVIYRDFIASTKFLQGKKVVVVDLDDTVWKGTIGEGAVEHYMDRQKTLKLLKMKGVLLAIASKNDRGKVHWTGGVLQSEDFVAEEINWDPKPLNIKKIANELNLKLKDFVFIDDRADQRELVKASIPELETLDATSEASWRMLHWWAIALPEQNETDRTQLYHERKQRESFLDVEAEKRDQQTLLATLDLRLSLRPAGKKDLARVAELINRTNQFNTCASRTSLQQVTAWSESPLHLILVGEASDRFGKMGIVSAMVLEAQDGALTVGAWVLSCRVFGLGLECAMLNYARRQAQRMECETIRGAIVETPNNGPCREVYANHGFAFDGTAWVSAATATTADPEWLAVEAVFGPVATLQR